jgi:hypothetical protein
MLLRRLTPSYLARDGLELPTFGETCPLKSSCDYYADDQRQETTKTPVSVLRQMRLALKSGVKGGFAPLNGNKCSWLTGVLLSRHSPRIQAQG